MNELDFSKLDEENKKDFEQYYLEFYKNCVVQIKKKMVEMDVTQKEIEEITGLKQPVISRLLNMDVIPRLDTLLKVTCALGIDIELK
ncbi:helix-turn-helix transcriptional regulator [Niallia alba]|uniref:helix-turn-helix domain-containing protein n=1 Tax=Niallia alba TaxID=2729105 RepID=UPI002E1BD5E5|nr:helix-turn-helix transcriptional regulator [Niallia alba]